MDDVVREVMAAAKRRFGKADAFLLAITPYIRKKDYKRNAVYSWLNGNSMPPAEVVLAAAKVSNLALDEYLSGESIAIRLDQVVEEQRQTAETLREVQEQVRGLREALEGRRLRLQGGSAPGEGLP